MSKSRCIARPRRAAFALASARAAGGRGFGNHPLCMCVCQQCAWHMARRACRRSNVALKSSGQEPCIRPRCRQQQARGVWHQFKATHSTKHPCPALHPRLLRVRQRKTARSRRRQAACGEGGTATEGGARAGSPLLCRKSPGATRRRPHLCDFLFLFFFLSLTLVADVAGARGVSSASMSKKPASASLLSESSADEKN